MYQYKKIIVDGKCIDRHRHIMQQHLGRKLTRHEVVHHKDEDKSNDDISNLEVMTLAEHGRLHAKVRVYGKEHSDKMRVIGLQSMNGAKLKECDVYEIYKLINEGLHNKAIANLFNVSRSAIFDIRKGRTWTHLLQKTA